MSLIVTDARELKTSSGRYVQKLLNYLQRIDKKNKYKVLLKPEDVEDFNVVNNNFDKQICKFKEFSLSEQIGLKKQIESLSPDLVHFCFPQQPALFKGKVVTTFHDLTTLRFNNPENNFLVFNLKQKIYSWLLKRVAKKSKHIIATSNFTKKDLLNFSGIDSSKVTVIYHAADLIKDNPEQIVNLKDKNFIMYVGRPFPHKNLNRLILAFVNLKQENKDLVLVLAGKEDNNYRRIKQKTLKEGYKDILFTGYVSEGQLKWLYENCQAYIFPSLSEGFGLPGLEAMVHGAPVVSSNATCLPEIYGDAAIYFNPTDIEDMAQKIDEVLSNKQLRETLINKGKVQVDKYSWEKTAKQTLEVYEKVLNSN